MPGATDLSDRQTVFLNFHFSNFFVFFSFFFVVKICRDDDCRTTVETSACLLLSILSGDNDLL